MQNVHVVYSTLKPHVNCLYWFTIAIPTQWASYLCDGVSKWADHCAPHHPQLLFVLQGLGIAADGPQHCLPECQRRGWA